eukprot:scaffold2682_cov344-Pavlova_lutheri.AAC.24
MESGDGGSRRAPTESGMDGSSPMAYLAPSPSHRCVVDRVGGNNRKVAPPVKEQATGSSHRSVSSTVLLLSIQEPKPFDECTRKRVQ